MVMWLIGEVMMFFFMYCLFSNMVRRKSGLAKNIPQGVNEKKITMYLTFLVWAFASLLIICVVLLITLVRALFLLISLL